MLPSVYNISPFTAGDHWSGIPLITITVNGAAPASPLASARMRFACMEENELQSGVVVELTSAAGKITIVSEDDWQLTVPQQAVPRLTGGRWRWNIETTAADGTVKTYLRGEVTVNSDV